MEIHFGHTRNYIETFRAIMALLGVDIPSLDGHVQLRFLMTKKRSLEMMECVDEFVDSGVLQAVHQRTDKVKIARTAKVEEMMKALNPEEAANAAKRVEKEAARKARGGRSSTGRRRAPPGPPWNPPFPQTTKKWKHKTQNTRHERKMKTCVVGLKHNRSSST